MQLSKRMEAMPASPTVALNTKVKELSAQGLEIVNFTIGEPDFGTPEAIVQQAIISLKKGRTRYGPPGGGLDLRKAVTEKLQRENNLSFDPQQIVLGMGAKEILFHIALAMLDEGDEAIVPAPYWVSYPAHIAASGARCVDVPVPADFPKTKIDLKELESRISTRTKLLYLNSPNNPAGYVLSRSELEGIAALLNRHPQVWVISDEIYEFMSFESPHLSLLNVAPELADRFILVHGLAKNFAMTGWRVGFAAVPASLAPALRNLQSQSSTCLPGFIEDAAAFALHQGKAIVHNELALLKQRRDLAAEFAGQFQGCQLTPPQGAFYLFLDCRPLLESWSAAAETKTSMDLAQMLLEDYKVATVPGEAFGSPGYLRISYAVDEQQLRSGLAACKTCFEQISKSKIPSQKR